MWEMTFCLGGFMNIGILGTGNIARTMARTLSQMNDARLLAIGSRSMDKAESFGKEFCVERAYGSYQELAVDNDLDLVYIASPHSHHMEHALLCLNAGRNILCEKAFMVNAGQAEKVLGLAREKNLFVAEAIWPRYLPMRRMISDEIDNGIIGKVRMVRCCLGHPIGEVPRIKNPELAGGALLDITVYPINFSLMVLGEHPKTIMSQVVFNSTGMDYYENICFKYDDGAIADIVGTCNMRMENDGFIYGDDGYMKVRNLNNPEWFEVYDKKGSLVKKMERPQQISGYEYEVLACMEALREGKSECPQMSHEASLNVMRIMDGLRKSWGMKYPFEKQEGWND